MSTERDRTQLLHALARRAAGLFGRQWFNDDLHEGVARLKAEMDQMSLAVGLMDTTGTWVITNIAMQRFVPELISLARLATIAKMAGP